MTSTNDKGRGSERRGQADPSASRFETVRNAVAFAFVTQLVSLCVLWALYLALEGSYDANRNNLAMVATAILSTLPGVVVARRAGDLSWPSAVGVALGLLALLGALVYGGFHCLMGS